MKQNISIIGCGWLGFPLAKSLIRKGYRVKGSTTTKEKIKTLSANGIEGFLVKLSSEGVVGNINDCLSESDLLILNIPPGLRKHPEANYVRQMQNLVPFINTSDIKYIILVSSTSVYKDDESFPVITELSPKNIQSPTAKQLLDVESLFLQLKNIETSVIRFAGLFGDDRHPAQFLSGRQQVKNPNAPVNLIHKDDCIGIIERMILQNTWNEVFNAATSPHPTKQSYYTSVCEKLNLVPPTFDTHKTSIGKRINSKKLARVLDYEFKIKL